MDLVKLSRPSLELSESYFQFIEAMRLNGDFIWSGNLPEKEESTEAFVARNLQMENSVPEGMVLESRYWATINNIVVGKISLRHALNESLREFGGNIGYEVHPIYRRRGVARDMLRQVLESTTAKRIGRLLLTCAPDNLASIKVIEANGGVFERTQFVSKIQRDTNYYWICLE